MTVPLKKENPMAEKNKTKCPTCGNTRHQELVPLNCKQMCALIIDNSSAKRFDIPINYDVKVNVVKLAEVICERFGTPKTMTVEEENV